MGLVATIGALGGVGVLSAGAACIRWFITHRPVRLSVAVNVDGPAIYLAVRNHRVTSHIEGRITDIRGITEKPVWPWLTKWRHTNSPAQPIAHDATALLQLAEAYHHYPAPGILSASFEDLTLIVASPLDEMKRVHATNVDTTVEVDVQLTGQGHGGKRPTLTVEISFGKPPKDWDTIFARIGRTDGIVSG
jgi:hypothetical protein